MTNQNRPKIILVPYPAQGHVTPIIKLASLLARQGFEPVVITTEFIHRSISHQIDRWNEISFIGIPDGIEEGSPRDFFATERAMENVMPASLERILVKSRAEEQQGGGVIACLVVDLLASWAIKVARQRGIPVAGFWPAMAETYHLIKAIPEMIRTGFISDSGDFLFFNMLIIANPIIILIRLPRILVLIIPLLPLQVSYTDSVKLIHYHRFYSNQINDE